MFKRLAVLLLCLITVFIATFGFVVGVVAVPTIYSYAEVVDDDSIYTPLRSEGDLVKSFQAYCKSRDLTIEGSIADAVTTFTTGAFNSCCNSIGVDITQLQGEIKAEYDTAGNPVKFLYNTTGVSAMNRIFAQFLQDNELEVGDTVDETVYTGDFNSDINSFVYIAPSSRTSSTTKSQVVTTEGMPYLGLTSASLLSGHTWSSATVSNTYYVNDLDGAHEFYIEYYWSGKNSDERRIGLTKTHGTNYENIYRGVYSNNNWVTRQSGEVCIWYVTDINKYYLGTYYHQDAPYTLTYYKSLNILLNFENQTAPTTVNIILTTNNNVINNNNYEGDTYITNEGDVIDDTPVNPGGNDPGWNIGGGEGQATDGNGNTWNITFPDFELPDLNIDWSIQGLGDKFPFSIPFDLVALVTVLNAEPEAPRFEGTVNFGFTTWDYDINLEQFDSVASVCRIAELLLLVFGLILITRSIIKG